MPQSLIKNYVHIIFSTKNREHTITETVEDELYDYIGGICKSLECYPVQVGGFTNHIHILCLLSTKMRLMKLVEEVKSHSSLWMKTKEKGLESFYWQLGYGAFSVSPSQVDIVKAYILNQKEHHSKKTFEDEFRAILKKYKVEYNEKYVWD